MVRRRPGARALEAVGLLAPARRLRRAVRMRTDAAVRAHARDRAAGYAELEREAGAALRAPLVSTASARPAMVVSARCPAIEVELVLLKALQLGGYAPTVVVEDEKRALEPYYALAGAAGVKCWSTFASSRDCTTEATALLDGCRSISDVLAIEWQGVRVGLVAASTVLRRQRTGSLDVKQPADRRALERALAASLTATLEAHASLDQLAPELLLMVNTEYTPNGELFDAALSRGVDVVAYDTGHRTNTLLFKRYLRGHRDHQLASLSDASWDRARQAAWTPESERALEGGWVAGYETGDWYSASWTQRLARPIDAEALRIRLGLDPAKPTAIVFAHIVWDAPFRWSASLFQTYEAWLVETVRAACGNDRVNWIIKIHPAHVGKRQKEALAGDPAEVRTLRSSLPPMPSHVHIVPAETDISTMSLLRIADYALTVRGTVGIEAACLGIPVLTAASARYDRRGFTVDSASAHEYLARVANVEEIHRLSTEQQTLAKQYAKALFLDRPLTMSSVTWMEPPVTAVGPAARARATIHVRHPDAWLEAPDVTRLSTWLGASDAEDFRCDP